MQRVSFCSFNILLSATLTLAVLSGCATRRIAMQRPTDYDAIVIGAGMGGLSSGVHLANGGLKVLVIDKGQKVGGCTSSFKVGEYRFDTALHMMNLGIDAGLIRILKQAGVYDKLELIRVGELGKSVFPDFEYRHPNGFENYMASLAERWPKEKANLKKFEQLVLDIIQETRELRDMKANGNSIGKLLIPLRQPHIFKYRKHTLQQLLDEHFEDKQLKEVLGQFWMYYGPPPSELLAIIYLISSYSYWTEGGYQIKGSSQALSNAYRDRIIELGGKVLTNTLVTSINVKDKKVQGVTIQNGRTFTSRYVISSADPYQTFYKLIGKDKAPRRALKKLKKMEPNSSLAGVYLGVNVTPERWGVKDYEIFLNQSSDSEVMHKSMLKGDYSKGAAIITLYGNLNDPYYAPKGKSVIVIDTYSQIDDWPPLGTKAYEEKKRKMVETLIAMGSKVLPGLKDHIEVAVGMTPRTIKQYTMHQNGTPYGRSLTPDQFFGLSNDTNIEGLYLAGSWVWPAHGVSMTQVSGHITAKMIMQNEERMVQTNPGSDGQAAVSR